MFRLSLARGVARLSAFAPLRRLFYLAYRVQLWVIAQRLGRQRGIVGVVLRRPGVLVDAYPGVSDFDLTCIYDSTQASTDTLMAEFHRAHRRLKRLLPVLGETKLIDRQDLVSHLEAEAPTLGGGNELHVLTRRGEFSQRVPAASWPSLRRRISAYYKECFLPLRYRPRIGRLATLQMEKETARLHWLLDGFRDPHLPPLVYHHRMPGARRAEADLGHLDDRLREKAADEVNCPILPTRIWRVGAPTPAPAELQEAVHRIERRLGRPILLSRHRPYQFNWSIVFRTSGEDPSTLFPEFREIQNFSRILSPTHPLIVDDVGWKVALEWDALAHLLVPSKEESIEVDELVLRHELISALALLPSLLRRQDTNYLLDVFFGQLVAIRVMLETKVFYQNIEALLTGPLRDYPWTSGQKSLLELYVQGDQAQLDSYPTLTVWREFRRPIEEEMAKARKWIATEMPTALPRPSALNDFNSGSC